MTHEECVKRLKEIATEKATLQIDIVRLQARVNELELETIQALNQTY